MATTRKSIFFDDIGGSAGNTRQNNAGAPSSSDDWFSGSASEFMSSTFQNSGASDFILKKGMEGLYDGLSGRMSQNSDITRSWFGALKCYFDVNHAYVLRKLFIILFPLKHSNWSQTKHQQDAPEFLSDTKDGFSSKTRDINAPDLYIPLMSFISYILLIGAIMGNNKTFEADQLGSIALYRLFTWIFEIVALRLGLYFFSVDISVIDVAAYTGYKFVSILLSIVASLFFGAYAYFPVGIITSSFMSLFMIKTLRKAAMNSEDMGVRLQLDQSARSRNWFLFVACIVQIPLLFIFTYPHAHQVFFVSK